MHSKQHIKKYFICWKNLDEKTFLNTHDHFTLCKKCNASCNISCNIWNSLKNIKMHLMNFSLKQPRSIFYFLRRPPYRHLIYSWKIQKKNHQHFCWSCYLLVKLYFLSLNSSHNGRDNKAHDEYAHESHDDERWCHEPECEQVEGAVAVERAGVVLVFRFIHFVRPDATCKHSTYIHQYTSKRDI